ncbi:hypothetical protein [Anditalea andensis]|uniref:hypothetical protein n=1 Tax=Anditalea andensis TaxID=1048983 RepID=UPI001F0A9FD7|nr:hypothetical protein [Anditalea andensis]
MVISSLNLPLSDIIRDLKKHTDKKIMKANRDNEKESRKSWLIWLLTKDNHIWFWEEGYHEEEIFTQNFMDSKINYIT